MFYKKFNNKIMMFIALLALVIGAFANVGNANSPSIAEKVFIDQVWAGHPVGFDLLTQEQRQYVAYYNKDRQMILASRQLNEKNWNKQILPSKVGWDSHNYVTIALDQQGYIHLSGNMHVDPLIYFRSEQPYDITNMQPVHRMTGEAETRVTYPRFMKDNEGRLLFMYRAGSSGNGRRLINRYDEETQSWERLIDEPLLNGQEQDMNAYPAGIKKGPDGWFHLVWMWRDTPDCQTNHDISYARSKDLKQWQTAAGEAVTLPITPENKKVVVDPVPSREGLINMGFGLGFDPSGRVVIHYHKYDEDGNSQIYLARWENGSWKIYQPSSWDHRWEFGGGGSVPCKVRGQPVQVLPDGRLVQSWSHEKYGSGTWLLDPEALQPVDTIQLPPKIPRQLRNPNSDFEGIQVQWRGGSGKSPQPNMKYYLRWETLPQNRDRSREGPIPEPSDLTLYKFEYSN